MIRIFIFFKPTFFWVILSSPMTWLLSIYDYLKFISSVLSSEPQTPIAKWPPSIFTVFQKKVPSAISKKKKSALNIFLS